MKTLFYILAFLFTPIFLSAQWEQSAATSNLSPSIYLDIPTSPYIHAFTGTGTYRTHNFGLYWEQTNFDTSLPGFTTGFVYSKDTLFVAHNRTMFSSVDNGDTWTDESLNLPIWSAHAIQLGKTEHFTFIATGFGLFRKVVQSAAPAENIFRFIDYANSKLYCSGTSIWFNKNQDLYFSPDEGISWDTLLQNNPVYSLLALGDTALFCGQDSLFLSYNQVQLFEKSPLPYTGTNPTIRFSDSVLFYKTDEGPLLFSENMGADWLSFPVISDSQTTFGKLITAIKRGNQFLIAFDKVHCVRSIDNGQSWKYHNTILNGPFNRASLESVNDRMVFDFGAYSDNNKDNWFRPVYKGRLLGFLSHIYNDGEYYAIDITGSLYRTINADFTYWELLIDENNTPSISEHKLFQANGNIYRSVRSLATLQRYDEALNEWISVGTIPDANHIEAHKGRFYSYTYFIDSGTLVVSDDEGLTWNPTSYSFFSYGFPSNFIVSGDSVLFANQNNHISYSTDGGLSFSGLGTTGIPNGGIIYPMFFSTEKNNVLIKGTELYLSTNLKDEWYQIETPLTPAELNISNVFILDNSIVISSPDKGLLRLPLSSIEFMELSGFVYSDDNQNGQKDVGEEPLSGRTVFFGNDNWTRSATDGTFTIFSEQKEDTLSMNTNLPWATVTPNDYVVDTTTNGLDFGVHFPANTMDMRISHANKTVYRPGFESEIQVHVRNVGTVDFMGKVQLVLDASMSFLNAYPSPTAILGDTLIWDMHMIPTNSNSTINVEVEMDVQAPLGNDACTSASVRSMLPDATPCDNAHEWCSTIVGSYEPNDKRCVQGNTISPDDLESGEELDYIVRFQNTGTYHAKKVVIVDTLSPHLDLRTFSLVSSSHHCIVELEANRTVKFVFSPIYLPDSTRDEPASHGYVQYKIAPYSTLPLGTHIENTAAIYFDFNEPIITNTVKTTVQVDVSKSSFIQENQIPVYPNPTTGMIYFDVKPTMLRIYSAQGRLVLENENVNDGKIDISRLPNGQYTLGFYMEDRTIYSRVSKM